VYNPPAHDTIAAPASAAGEGALAIIRVSGDDAHRIAGSCLAGRQPFDTVETMRIVLYSFLDPQTKKMLDNVTAIRYKGPRSYTGEDMAEIFCHGSKYVVDCILSSLFSMGARLAQPGEFTKRALLGGKINLLRAESILALVQSRSMVEHENAVEMYRGNSGKALAQMKDSLEDALVDIESRIDFGEEDQSSQVSYLDILGKISAIEKNIEDEIETRKRVKRIEKGVVVVILGESNAGKSSLFNTILDTERSIVHSSKGTTRDYISEDLYIEGMLISLIDTAGFRDPENEIESAGIERSWHHAATADVAIFVTSAEQNEFTAQEELFLSKRSSKKTMAIINKSDLGSGLEKTKALGLLGIAAMSVCLLKDNDKKRASEFVGSNLRANYEPYSGKAILLNIRQETLAVRILGELRELRKTKQISEELIAEHIKNALRCMNELVGISTPEKILEEVFSRFCIGK
jgi:tRNA modification GTPase